MGSVFPFHLLVNLLISLSGNVNVNVHSCEQAQERPVKPLPLIVLTNELWTVLLTHSQMETSLRVECFRVLSGRSNSTVLRVKSLGEF